MEILLIIALVIVVAFIGYKCNIITEATKDEEKYKIIELNRIFIASTIRGLAIKYSLAPDSKRRPETVDQVTRATYDLMAFIVNFYMILSGMEKGIQYYLKPGKSKTLGYDEEIELRAIETLQEEALKYISLLANNVINALIVAETIKKFHEEKIYGYLKDSEVVNYDTALYDADLRYTLDKTKILSEYLAENMLRIVEESDIEEGRNA